MVRRTLVADTARRGACVAPPESDRSTGARPHHRHPTRRVAPTQQPGLPVLQRRLRLGVAPLLLLPVLLPLLLRGLGRSQGLQPAFEVTQVSSPGPPPLPPATAEVTTTHSATPTKTASSGAAGSRAAVTGGSGGEGLSGGGGAGGRSHSVGPSALPDAGGMASEASSNSSSLARSPVPVPLGSIPCLRTRPPPELQWPVMHMRCAADGVVQVTDELDEYGALHRTLLHRPLRGVNSSHLAWWFGTALPSTLYFRGRAWDAYKLWHPVDHILFERTTLPDPRPPQSPAEAPRTGPVEGAGGGSLPAIHIVERFRTPAFNATIVDSSRGAAIGNGGNSTSTSTTTTTTSNSTSTSTTTSTGSDVSQGAPLPPEYPLDMALVLNDTQSNMHRLLFYMGPTVMQELSHTWEDSPEGLLITSRFILGGRNPSAAVFNGAARANAFPPPRLQAWLAHCVEEFGNFPYFLPAVYDTQAAMVTLKAG